ncbi:MAG TPA: hypothetical protein VI279_00635 [Rhodocyclaceae bacterium]
MKFVLKLIWVFFLSTTAALAQSAAGSTASIGFECWIGEDGKPYHIHYIRCIADRDIPPEASVDARFDELLELIHQELHVGSPSQAEEIFKANIHLIKESGGVWDIRIYSYPPEWSWAEGRPEQLVRSVLCRGDRTCPVVIRRR